MVKTGSDGRHIIEFQFRGIRVHRRCAIGATVDDAQARAKRMRHAIINGTDLDAAYDGQPPIETRRNGRDDWVRVASILIRVAGIQPRPGVYLLSKTRAVIYVGQSRNVARRIGDHYPKEYDHAVMVEADDAELSEIEQFLIRMLRPPMNFQGARRRAAAAAGAFLVGSAGASCGL